MGVWRAARWMSSSLHLGVHRDGRLLAQFPVIASARQIGSCVRSDHSVHAHVTFPTHDSTPPLVHAKAHLSWNASVKESAIYGKLIGCAPVDLMAHAADDCLGEKLRAERVENAVGRCERGKRASRQKLPRGGQAPCECCVSGRSPRSRAAALAWCSVQRLA